MKLLLIPALLLATATGPSIAVRMESNGVRVGSEFVTGTALSLKEAGAPLLVSGSIIESLSGETLAVSLGEKQVALGAGLRLSRTADGFALSTHGLSFTVESAGKTLTAERSASFKVTEKGFDFGALGVLEGASFAAKVAGATVAPAVAGSAVQQDGEGLVSPERETRRGRSKTLRRLYSVDPLAGGEAASSIAVRQIPRVTPEGAP
jgi:hypothetical protein